MITKEFFEKYPLYKTLNFEPKISHYSRIEIGKLSSPAINMHCSVCKSTQTYNAEETSKYLQPLVMVANKARYIKNDNIFRIQYTCTGCYSVESMREFFIKFNEWSEWDDQKRDHIYYLEAQKVGQYPAWDIRMDKELESLLGKYAKYYKNGLICESQSYGIGSFAYFRRITEEIINTLIESIAEFLDGEELKLYKEALEKVRATTVTQEKIELIKDLLPAILRPDGVNPLSALHSSLSEGIHAKSDEECMEYAETIRQVLIFLVNQVTRTKKDQKIFTEGVKKILEKKNGKK